MPITVQIPTALRRHTEGVGSITCAASNLGELFSVLDEKFPNLKPHLRDDKGQVRRFLNIYVNEEDIRFLGRRSPAGAVDRRRREIVVAARDLVHPDSAGKSGR
jgi:molybdopterin synthase sulfur carrier subunit